MSKEAIIPSFDAFAQKFPSVVSAPANTKRVEILKRYFAQNMVISLGSIPGDGNWPDIVYPTPMKLKKDLDRLQKLQRDLSARKSQWQLTLTKAKLFNLTSEVKKFSQPVYWKHLGKYFSDADYRKDADSVQLPVQLASEKRYKPMIEMFVNNLDYRKQLTDTVENSIVYKHNKKLARYATDLRELRMQQSQRTLDQTQKLLTEITTDIEMFQELLNWAKK